MDVDDEVDTVLDCHTRGFADKVTTGAHYILNALVSRFGIWGQPTLGSALAIKAVREALQAVPLGENMSLHTSKVT